MKMTAFLSVIALVLVCFAQAADCPPPNLTSQGALDQNVEKRALTNLTNAFIDLTVSVPVAATSDLSVKVVAIPFRFTGVNRAYKITVDFPAQTFAFTGPSRQVGLAELRGDVSQCNGGSDGLNKDTMFVSPYSGPLVPVTPTQFTATTKLRANTTYQVELVYIFQNVTAGSTEPWRVRIEPLTGKATEIITEIPIIQPISNACDRTAIEYTFEALLSEQAVRGSLLDARIELELRQQEFLLDGSAKNQRRLDAAKQKAAAAVATARASVRAAKRALHCAREKVAADGSLASDVKADIIADLDSASNSDDLAITSLNDADAALGTFGGTTAAIQAINTANDRLLDGVVSKKAALRALDAAEEAGIEAANAAKKASELAAEAARAVFDFAKRARLIVRQGGASPAAVIAEQEMEESRAAFDELKAGVLITREAAEKHIKEVQDAATKNSVRNEGDKVRTRIDGSAARFFGTVEKAEARVNALMGDADPTPADYLRRAKKLETDFLFPILSGKIKGETRYGTFYRYVLSEINRYRKLGGLPPLEQY